MARRTNSADPAQSKLFDPPPAPATRTRDPETSKAAAGSVRKIAASHKRILAMFEKYGDMTDETLAVYLDELAEDGLAPKMSPSGIRSRRSDLSKPNMERLAGIVRERGGVAVSPGDIYSAERNADEKWNAIVGAARHQLRTEGWRSPLWDTGKRETMSSTGRQAVVWGIAR